MLDRLTAGATNFTTGGNPIAGFLNMISGLTTGTRTDPAGMQAQTQLATYNALRGAGLPAAVAKAAALNPDVMKTIAPQLYSRPTLVESGVNPLTGQKSYVWSQPDLMQVKPAVVEGNPVSGMQSPTGQALSPQNAAAIGLPAMSNNDLSKIDALVKSGANGEELMQGMQAINPAFANKVKSMANGDIPYPSGFIMKTPYGNMLTDAISAYKPGVTAQDFASKQKARNYWTSGGGAQEIKAINTAIQHAVKMQPVSEKMGGTDIAPDYLNPLIQGTKVNIGNQEYQTAQKEWDALSETLSTEISKALNGGVPHVADKEHWRAIFSRASGPTQRTAALSAAMNILEGRTASMAPNYEQAMGSARNPIDFIDPANREAFASILGGRKVGSTPTPQAPQKAQLSGIDQQALDWANANPRDPRAAAIKRKLGVQ
jgi:hypothetical protein